MKNLILGLLSIFILIPNANAFNPACEPILKAGEARAMLASWQSTTVVNGKTKLEFLKSAGQHYMRRNGEKWTKMPVSPDGAEQEFASQVRSDKVKLTECKIEGSQTLDGIEVKVISYTLEMPGAPAVQAKLLFGKADELPYAQFGNQTESHYRYKDLDKP